MSSKRLFAGLAWVGRQFLPSLFTGVGSGAVAAPAVVRGTWAVPTAAGTWARPASPGTWENPADG